MSREILVNYEEKPCYKIFIERSFNQLGAYLSQNLPKNYKKVCIVTDSNVADIYLSEVAEILRKNYEFVTDFVIPAGEPSKNLKEIEKLYEKLIVDHFDRNDLLVALGGGVIGDMTGFAAATYLRGIDFVQVPTTLLAQVDSSVGGKTGVDFNGYKNMIGAFYMPKLVYMNISALKSLPEEQFICGLGEVVKHGFIKDKLYFNYLLDNSDKIKGLDDDALEEIVYGSAFIKRNVVEIDPKEQSIRAHLNFGHTIGHAVEKLSNFTLFHGQCVGIGMVAALYLSNKLGKISDSDMEYGIKTIASLGLPTFVENMDAKLILEATKSDKKMAGSKVKFVILNTIGDADIYRDFNDDDLLEAINYIIK